MTEPDLTTARIAHAHGIAVRLHPGPARPPADRARTIRSVARARALTGPSHVTRRFEEVYGGAPQGVAQGASAKPRVGHSALYRASTSAILRGSSAMCGPMRFMT